MSEKIRQSVDRYADCVQGRLMQRVGDKGDTWADVHPLWLICKLAEEFGEVAAAINHAYGGGGELLPASEHFVIEAITECYDIGAMAMILSEVLSDELAREG